MSKTIPNALIDNDSPQEKAEKEFGSLTSKEWLFVSKHNPGEPLPVPIEDEPPYFILIATYLNYLILIIIGHIRDFFGKLFHPELFRDVMVKDGIAPWYANFESFYTRRLKTRLDDCFARPICGVPGRYIKCYDRTSDDYNNTYNYSGTVTERLNLSSYNYLGFAQSSGLCTSESIKTLEKYGTNSAGPRVSVGTTDLHLECENVVAKFTGKDNALVFSMGYGTNANLFTSLVDSKCCVISDSLNHGSIRTGVRLSGASVKTFAHNDMAALESTLRSVISQGQPKTHRPWKKIFVAVEGLYSMEGTLCNLPKLVELRERYKFYLFVDEAHSIGAMGPHGKGVCDYFGISSSNIDIMMGTFTKSFGATGGYIAADKAIIDRLKLDLTTNTYGESMSPAVLTQIITSLKIIDGQLNGNEGKERLQRIAFNSRYLRLGLKRLGFIVYGADDSPVIPLLLYLPPKMPAFSRMMYDRKVAVVVVGYPATDITSSRIRFCVSSSLKKEDIDYLLKCCDEIGDTLFLKFSTGIAGGEKHPGDYKKGIPPRWSLKEVLEKTPEDCKKAMY
ncbi:BA75_03809T0 [Komagataella pastoris]|uniref:BA75_03809T0 n=1 Tax=Komagataella pastoris TaxID=4922 RepID=A0A1B2JFP9_PICPA|nr:BA75_03809T0 [Komagataella pastoris]